MWDLVQGPATGNMELVHLTLLRKWKMVQGWDKMSRRHFARNCVARQRAQHSLHLCRSCLSTDELTATQFAPFLSYFADAKEGRHWVLAEHCGSNTFIRESLL